MKRLHFLLIFYFSPYFAFASENNSLCSGKQENLKCLRKNFSELYRTNLDRTFKILHQGEKFVKKCSSFNDVVDYLAISSSIKANAEVTESYGETIENAALDNPKCLLKAASTLNESNRSDFVYFLSNPTYKSTVDINKKIMPLSSDKDVGNLATEIISKLNKSAAP